MPITYNAFKAGPLVVPGYHDPDSIRTMGIVYRPDTWAANTAYERRYDNDADAVMPTTYKGLYFRVKYPGMSGATDPFTGTYVAGDEIEDGTLVWEAVNYNLMPVTETISSITVTATHSMTIASSSHTDTSVTFTIPAVSTTAESDGYFEVTVRATKSTGDKVDTTLYFKVAER